jgi:hypothetical protein
MLSESKMYDILIYYVCSFLIEPHCICKFTYLSCGDLVVPYSHFSSVTICSSAGTLSCNKIAWLCDLYTCIYILFASVYVSMCLRVLPLCCPVRGCRVVLLFTCYRCSWTYCFLLLCVLYVCHVIYVGGMGRYVDIGAVFGSIIWVCFSNYCGHIFYEVEYGLICLQKYLIFLRKIYSNYTHTYIWNR